MTLDLQLPGLRPLTQILMDRRCTLAPSSADVYSRCSSRQSPARGHARYCPHSRPFPALSALDLTLDARPARQRTLATPQTERKTQ
jgi:hypothetical protein